MKRFSIYFFILLCANHVSLAANVVVDSLKQVLNTDINDSVRADTYYQISYATIFSNITEAEKYARLSLSLSKAYGFSRIQAKCNNILAVVSDEKSDGDSAEYFYREALKLFEGLQDTVAVGYMYSNIAMVYNKYYGSKKALPMYMRALEITTSFNTPEQEAIILGNIAVTYINNEDYPKALASLYEALEIEENNHIEHNPPNLLSLGTCYYNFRLYDKAIGFYRTALQYCLKTENMIFANEAFGNLFKAYLGKRRYDSAFCYLNMLKQNTNVYIDSIGLHVKASSYYLSVDSLGKAGKHLAILDNKTFSPNDLENFLLYKLNKSEYYRKTHKPLVSIETLKSLPIDSIKWYTNIFDIHTEFSKVYYQLRDLEKAYQHQLLANQWKDSLNITTNKQLIIEKDLTFKYEKRKQVHEALQKQKSLETELELSQKKKLNLLLGTLMSFVLVITVIVYLNLGRKRKDNKLLLNQKHVLEKKEELMASLLRELNHRVKNNLQMVSSLFTMQRYNTSDAKVQEALQKAAGRIDSLTVLYQYMYKRNYPIAPGIREYLTDLCNKIVHATGLEDRVKLQMNIEDISLDIAKMTHIGLITNELLTNALKYGVDGTNNNRIGVSFIRKDEKYKLGVFNKIYTNRGTTAKENSSKFGLTLVKNIAQRYQGEVNTNFETDAKVEVLLNLK